MAASEPTATTDLGFDPDALRRKYREERDKRLREDGNEQYIEVKGEFAHFLDDPYAEPGFEREPLFGRGRGAGGRRRLRGAPGRRPACARPGWRTSASSTRRLGLRRHLVLEPLPRHRLRHRVLHLPAAPRGGRLRPQGEVLLRASEILDHSQAIARKFDLYRDVCFQTRVEELRWDEDDGALGDLHEPGRPHEGPLRVPRHGSRSTDPSSREFPASRTFEGHSFHASRWDYDYTGGDSEGNLTGLRGKRVGHHRHRRDLRAVRARTWASGPSTSTCSSARRPPSTSRRTRPTDPEWAKFAPAGLAPAPNGQLQRARLRRATRPRTW